MNFVSIDLKFVPKSLINYLPLYLKPNRTMQTRDNYFIRRVLTTLVLIVFFIFTQDAFSQKTDSTKSVRYFGAAATVTNNGISLLPTFSLGKPAAIFDLNVGNNRLSFEPQFRFALEGKPWSFIFWWRYKLLQKERFKINIGAHPAILFRTMPVTINGVTSESLVAQRYIAEEFAPNYYITKDISIGIYYLHSNGFDEGATKNTDFITINSNFTNIKLSKEFYMKFFPQVFYLRMDGVDGFYATATTTLARKNFPLSIQSILNQAIKTNIKTKSDFLWNVSLIYSFRNEYVKK